MNATERVRRISYARRLAKSGAARAMRQEAGVTIRELAAAVGTTPSTLARWEVGENAPRAMRALAWLEALEGLAK